MENNSGEGLTIPGGLTDEGKEDILLGVTLSRIQGEGEGNLHSLELVTYWESGGEGGHCQPSPQPSQ